MTDEPDTPLDSGTDNVTPENDTAPEWDYFDPDEDQDNEEAPEADATDEGEAEAEDTPPEAEEQPEDAAEPEVLELPDGSKIAKDEAIKGYLRQADYTRKSQELAQKRQAIEADMRSIEGVMEAFIDHITGLVPQEPDISLAMRSPDEYVRRKAQYDAAIAQVQKLVELGKAPKEVKSRLEQGDKSEILARENALLVEAIPEARTPEGRKQFFAKAADAAKEIGFTMEELQGIDDHRMFVALSLVNEALQARKAKAVAKEKVAKAPPVVPRKPGNPAPANRNAEAMRKLARSGSLKDALAVDWE